MIKRQMSAVESSLQRSMASFEPFHPCHVIDTCIVQGSAVTPWGLYQTVTREIHARVLGIVQRVQSAQQAASDDPIHRIVPADALIHALDLARELHRLCEWERKINAELPEEILAANRWVLDANESVARRVVAIARGEGKVEDHDLFEMSEPERALWAKHAALGPHDQRAAAMKLLGRRDELRLDAPRDVPRMELEQIVMSCLNAGHAQIEGVEPVLALEPAP